MKQIPGGSRQCCGRALRAPPQAGMEVVLDREDYEQIQLPLYDDKLGYYAPDGSGIIHATDFYQRTLDSGVAAPGEPAQFSGRADAEVWKQHCPSSIVPLLQKVRADKGISQVTASELFHIALFIDLPHLNYPAPLKRKREKRSDTVKESIAAILKQLQADPQAQALPVAQVNALFKIPSVLDQFRKHSCSGVARLSALIKRLAPGTKSKDCYKRAQDVFLEISNDQKCMWKFLCLVYETLYLPSPGAGVPRKRIPLPSNRAAPEIDIWALEPDESPMELPASGFLITTNTDVGMMSAPILEARNRKVSFEEMLDLIAGSAAHHAQIEEYYAWVCSWAFPLGFTWVSVCMELCREPDQAGRVPLHASVSLPIKINEGGGGAAEKHRWQSIKASDLHWHSRRPNIRRCGAKPRQVGKLLGGMHYYTLAKKDGRVGGRANITLFQDRFYDVFRLPCSSL